MNWGINKILFVVLGVLMFIFIVVFIFYFIISNQNVSTSKAVVLPTFIPTSTVQTILSPSQTQPTQSPDRGISSSNISSLNSLQKDVLRSSLLTNSLSGRITKLDFTGGILKSSNFNYIFSFRIESDSKRGNSFYFTQSNLNNLQIFKNDQNKNKVELTINDLKIGNTITFNQILDLTKDSKDNLVSGEINVE